MKTLYKIFRALAVTLLTLVIALPLVLYILLSLSGVQQKLKEAACRELSELLQTPVEIGDLSIYLPSRLVIEDVAVKDSTGVDALWIDRVDAAFEVRSFFENGNIIITLAEIDGLKANLYKETPESPLNIAHIIEALKPKEKNKPPTQFDLRVGHVLIRGSEFAYNVKSMPAPTDGVFDPNHIEIKNINLNLLLPRVSNDHYIARLRRLSMTERSGLRLSNMQFDAELSPKQLDVKSLTLRMPGSTLMLDDMQFKFDGFDKLAAAVFREDYSIGLRDGSHLMPADLAPLYRPLGNLTFPVDLSLTASGLPHRGIRVQQFIASSAERGFAFKIADARLTRNVTPEGNSIPVIEVGETELKANVAQALDIVGNFTTIPPKVQSILTSLETVAATGSGSYSAGQIIADVNVETAAGNIDIDATASLPSGRRPATIEGQIITDALDVARVLDNDKLPGEVSMLADVNLSIEKPYPAGNADIRIASLRYRGYDYKDVKLEATSADQRVHFKLDFNDPHANLDVEGHLATGDVPSTDFYINAHNIDFDALNLTNSLTSRKLSFNVDASLAGRDINSIDGWVRMSNISFINADGKGINLPLIDIDSECSTLPKQITIDSDVVEGRLTGSFNFNTVARTARDILGRVLPAVFDTPTADEAVIAANMENDFSFDFLVKENENLDKMLNLPVSIEAPVEIKGAFSYPRNLMTLNVDAPFLLQKNKIITGSSLDLNIDGNSGEASLNVATTVPTKHGDMSLKLNNNAHDNNVETRLGWKIDHERDFSGRLGLTTAFERRATEDVSRLLTHIAVNPGEAIFNDTVWTVEPATINIGKNRVDVRGFLARHQDQRIAIDGTASADSISVLRLSLNDVDLDYIFETLEINNVAFGGMATGDFYASRLLSSEPRIYTPLLDVKGLSYNGCVMGDGTILSHWDGGDRAVVINATIDQADGRQSKINGRIRPLDEELDFLFEADHAQVGFLQPFMEAFARDVSGEASGTARL
ncbi:MAG: hypothetical protein J1E63_06190, partial [Muribaculaceae bacterium]|nr:hypothetical protein [Muribaculaceae bacterium]